jgi:type IV fimbrial biogenesis protein FimT
MLRRMPEQRGVSLVEILVGLGIVALLSTFAAPAFRTFTQNSHIRNGAEAIQNGLNLARSEAVRRNTPVQFVLGAGAAWTVGCVVWDANCPQIIQSRPQAEGSAQAAVATTEVVASTNAAVGTPVFTNTLVFNGLGKERTLPAANNAVFDISNPGGGSCTTMRCLRVVVTPGGQVRMCDPARVSPSPPALPDPQAC